MRTRLTLLLVLLAVGTHAQSQEPFRIEVVSIKRGAPDAQGASLGTRPGGGVSATNIPFRSLITLAYPGLTSDAIEGAPDWFMFEGYDVNAIYAGKPDGDRLQQAWRAVFADRLKLKARLETREVDAYALVLARPDQGVPRGLTRISTDCLALAAARRRGETPPDPPLTPSGQPPCAGKFGPGGLVVTTGMSLQRLAQSIQGATGRPWIDKTGLTGDYEFTLRYSSPRAGAAPDPDAPPDLFTALREQLGLKLEPTRLATNYLVIEHIDRPTPD